MIIVEGMDNTGKTTLIKRLLANFPMLGLKHSPSELAGTPKLVDWTERELEKDYDHIALYDRFPLISEKVYGPVLRGYDITGNIFPHWIQEHKPLIIYCRPPIKTIIEFGEREQMEGVKEQAMALIYEYDKLFDDLKEKTRVVTYNFEDEITAIHVLNTVNGYIKFKEAQPR